MPSAAEQVVAQAIPHLIAEGPANSWRSGLTPEQFFSLPEGGYSTPAEALGSSYPDFASPYGGALLPEYLAFIERASPHDAQMQYYLRAPHLGIPGFESARRGSWTYYTPQAQLDTGQDFTHTGRVYVSVPPDDSSYKRSLGHVGKVIGDTLNVPGINLKVGNSLDQTHSIVIYYSEQDITLDGLESFVQTLREEKVPLAPSTVLTAKPLIPGVGVSPEVPQAIQEEYRSRTGDAGLSWTQLCSRMLLISTRLGLAGTPITDVTKQQQELTEVAVRKSLPHFSGLLKAIGINPETYKPI